MTRDVLLRLAASLAACADGLRTPGEETGRSFETERVERLLRLTATDLTRHATALRRLDDEIDLLSRRRDDGRQLAELRRRRDRAEARAHSGLDDATRALLPGGDRLDPGTILRRLSGEPAPRRLSYFGRPPVDRGDRLLRLTALLLRGATPAHTPRSEAGRRPTTAAIIASRESRLTRIRHLLTGTASRPTTGAAT